MVLQDGFFRDRCLSEDGGTSCSFEINIWERWQGEARLNIEKIKNTKLFWQSLGHCCGEALEQILLIRVDMHQVEMARPYHPCFCRNPGTGCPVRMWPLVSWLLQSWPKRNWQLEAGHQVFPGKRICTAQLWVHEMVFIEKGVNGIHCTAYR